MVTIFGYGFVDNFSSIYIAQHPGGGARPEGGPGRVVTLGLTLGFAALWLIVSASDKHNKYHILYVNVNTRANKRIIATIYFIILLFYVKRKTIFFHRQNWTVLIKVQFR